MSTNAPTHPGHHQRRAAYAVLQPVLGDADSLQALAWLQERLTSDSVGDVIAFIDAVATRHRLDDVTRRGLYASLHAALRQPGETLPPDPLTAMLAARAQAQAATAQSWRPGVWPAPGRAATHTTTAPTASLTAAGDEPLAAAQAVFSALMAALVGSLQASALPGVRAASLVQIERAPISPLTRETACAAWHQTGPQAWALPGSVGELSELVHRVHLALCEVCGPEEADALLTSAARAAARVPEAATCSPGRLL